MKEDSRRTNVLIGLALLIIAAAFAAYAAILVRWLAAPAKGPAARPAQARADEKLSTARAEFRAKLLEPAAHVKLSEALWASGRPVDSFYVALAARELFGEEAFRKAHAELVLGAGGPAAEARRRLEGARDAASAIPIHAEIARAHANAPEGRSSLDALVSLASGDENGPNGETARLARSALEELHADEPKSPVKLAALGTAILARGDAVTAEALAAEALGKHPGHAGAARVLAMLSLRRRDWNGAARWLGASWEKDPDDIESAARLAQIYDSQRADPEGALPYYLAVYRKDPNAMAADGPVERRVRQILDARRESLLRLAPVESLGGRFRLDDASLRTEACLRAAAFKDPRWTAELGERLDDDVELVRRSADYALFQIAQNDPDAVRARRSDWLDSERVLVRIRALNLFADLDGRNALPAAVAALRDPDPAVRAFAKLMVIDHYFKDEPEAIKASDRYLLEEQDPAARALLERHGALVRPAIPGVRP